MPDSDPAIFNPAAYGPDVARLLEMDGGGQRLGALTCAECTSAAEQRPPIEGLTATKAGVRGGSPARSDGYVDLS